MLLQGDGDWAAGDRDQKQNQKQNQDPDPDPDPVMASSALWSRRCFTWEEIAQHSGQGPPPQDRWLVIDRKVYDISHFYKRHPGGARLLSSHAGQDVTVRDVTGWGWMERAAKAGAPGLWL